MKAIQTKYTGPTDTRGSRMIATAEGGARPHRLSVPYDHALNIDENHAAAALALKNKMGWKGAMVGGGLPDKSMAWVFENDYKINPARRNPSGHGYDRASTMTIYDKPPSKRRDNTRIHGVSLKIWHYSPKGEGLEYGLDRVTPVHWGIGRKAPVKAQYVFDIPLAVSNTDSFAEWLNGRREVYGSMIELKNLFNGFMKNAHPSEKLHRNPAPTKMRGITQDDLNAAARGLGMLYMSGDELRRLIEENKGEQNLTFAGKVIAKAAQQMLATKKRAGLITNPTRKTKRGPRLHVQAQIGGKWVDVALMADTPANHVKAATTARNYKRKNPTLVFRVAKG